MAKSFDTNLSLDAFEKSLKTSKEKQIPLKVRLSLGVFLIALIGVTLSMWGASWDITSHLLRTPETFFTPSHGILYAGVGISLISAILSLAIIKNKEIREKSFAFGLKLVIIGAIMQIIAGPGDFYWHELFGIDGLLSPTHITLALGILITCLGATIGFARIRTHLKNNVVANFTLPISMGVFWFSVMWLIFFFVLPISEGDTHDFNPDQYFAVVLSFVAIPFAFSIVFWSASKSFNYFGPASAAALVFVMMNITSNILTSEKLLIYLPWFAAPMIAAIAADYIINKKSKFGKHHEKIAGAVLGSTFFIFSFPMLAMTFLELYLFNDVFPYDVLHKTSENIFQIWMITVIPGAVAGMLGMMFASKKLKQISNHLTHEKTI